MDWDLNTFRVAGGICILNAVDAAAGRPVRCLCMEDQWCHTRVWLLH